MRCASVVVSSAIPGMLADTLVHSLLSPAKLSQFDTVSGRLFESCKAFD